MTDRNIHPTPKPDVPRVAPGSDDHWLSRPATVRAAWRVLGVVLGLLVLAQFLVPVKGHFPLENTFAFGAWFGFLACLAMVLAARVLGWWLKKPESYYGEADTPIDAGPGGGDAGPEAGGDDRA